MTNKELRILAADLDDARIIKLLESHVSAARAETAPGSAHALDLSGLKVPTISVWAAWLDGNPVGVGALKQMSQTDAEIKSMYTLPVARRRGVASSMLSHVVETAGRKGFRRLNLETGSWAYFEPARALYASFGFSECGPFGDYSEDSNSVFMTLEL